MSARPTRYDETMIRVMNREEARNWYAGHGRRRAWTVAHVVLTAATPAAFPLAGDNGALLIGLVIPLILLWCVCTGVLNSATRGLFELRDRALDERQLADRAQAFTVAHRVQLSLTLAVVGGLGLLHLLADEGVSAEVLLAALFGLGLTQWLLPLWTAVLRTPDEPADDDVEPAAA
ncbi:hypothetical protein [Streptomyces hainanensis]|uniref:Uncharacterized protein n=1 Tax=Streptomyces hainanensis TaxID=402648 RepID=A0A4R4SCH4_9ACTN|nr:hypothetical protein [Streptomyces hainanensis]TDC60880.1 hypothetical protein E1283_35790 [Streptomyces hainanensis]